MILLVYGTRPEYIKIKPLMTEMSKAGISYKTLFTGQHENLSSTDADYRLVISSDGVNRLDTIIQSCMNIPDEYFNGITHVLVQGDTTSVVGLALSAMHRKIKIIHLEAGLRTYDTDNPYPEEYNRRIVSSIADIHLCPTRQNKLNLINEGVDEKNCYVVGNTGLDNLVNLKENVSYKNVVLVTLHRRENHEFISEWFSEINKIAETYSDYQFILPIHPNPNVQKYKHLLTNLDVVEPLSHDELLNILTRASLVITDSGGIQEECSFLGKKCIVCRVVTERPESIGMTTFLAKHPSNLNSLVMNHLNNPKPFELDCPFGDGNASKKICKLFKALF